MKRTTNTVMIAIIILIIGFAIVFNSLVIRIPLGKVGVRTQQYALFASKGVVPRDYDVGFHRNFGLMDRWELFDATVQTLELSRDPREGDRRSADDVQIKTDDGNHVSMDMTVKYRIKPDEAHLLFQKLGRGDNYQAIVRQQSLNTFRRAYGRLKTEDFYNPSLRQECTSEALTMLRAEMEPRSVDILSILVRDVLFEENYERKIRDKKLADQEVELNKSQAAAAEMRGKTNVIVQETQAMVRVIESEKEAEIVRLQADTDKQVAEIKAQAVIAAGRSRADADLYAGELVAQAELLEKEAEAAGDLRIADGLLGSGGANYVTREAMRNLNLHEITVSTLETPFLQLDEMAEKMGGRR